MTAIEALYIEFLLRLASFSWLTLFDLLLVTAAFYAVLSITRHTRAAILLRGVIVFGILVLIVTVILPLPTFDWMMRSLFLAILVATPIIFHPELRRLLDRLGRNVGLVSSTKLSASESVLSGLARAIETMAGGRVGALIAIEGTQSLGDFLETGVAIEGKLSNELILSIFYKDNPLHDGAVILRDDQVLAAGCVLPLTKAPLASTRRLGTRHRAAVGLSEISDALVIVVSEETGTISIAQNGRLERSLDYATLRQRLFNFSQHKTPSQNSLSLLTILKRLWQYLWPKSSYTGLQGILVNVIFMFLAIVLAFVTWWFVSDQTDPAQQQPFGDIPLSFENLPPNTTLVSPPQTSVNVLVETTASTARTLTNRSFKAVVSLANLQPGEHNLPIVVTSTGNQVLVTEISPAALDITLEALITREVTLAIDVIDEQRVAPAYEFVQASTPFTQVKVTGAKSRVERVAQVQTSISVANASATLMENRPLRAVDENGREVQGVSLMPGQVPLTATIQQRFNARNLAVRPVTTGTLPSGYTLTGLRTQPESITVEANRLQLERLGSFVDTLPLDLRQVGGNFNVQVPLNLPSDVNAFDSQGNLIQNVTVIASVETQRQAQVISRTVIIAGPLPEAVNLKPAQVQLLVIAPVPSLAQLETQPELVQVLIQTNNLVPGQTQTITPTIIAPDTFTIQLIPPSISLEWPVAPTPTPPVGTPTPILR